MAEQEQTAVLDAEPTDATVTEQTATAAEAVTAGAAEAAEGGAEAAAPEFDLSTQDGIIAFRQANPAFDAYLKQQVDSAFDAGRQKADKDFRLKQGVEDVGRAALESLARKHGFEPDDEDKKNLLWVGPNRAAERVAAATKIIFKGLDAFGLADEEKAAYREQIEALADDPDRLETIADQVIGVGAQRVADNRVGNLTLEEVPKDSRLHASIRAYMEAEMAKELEARAAERERVENPPRRPAGAVTAGGAERYANMTPAEIANLSTDEWKRYVALQAGVS